MDSANFVILRSHFLHAFALLASLLLLTACDPPAKERVTPQTWFPLRLGGHAIYVQLAITPEEMQTGLMHRASLPENSGMLFIYDSPRRMSFWMMNTLIPLDIGFFTKDGILREVRSMRANDLTPVPSSRDDIQFALEMNAGWFEKNGVAPGAMLDLRALAAALRARGLNPATYNLEP
jgi:uncharacterized membrane protein (UPF0127 family)